MVRKNTKTRKISSSSGDDTDDSSGLENNQLPKQLQNLIDTYNGPKKKRKIFNGDEIASLKLRPSIVQRALQKNVFSSTPATKTFGKFFTSDSSYSPIGCSSENSEVEKKRAKLSDDPILIPDSDYQTDFVNKKSNGNENNKNASPSRFSTKSPGRTINEATTDKTPNKLVTSRIPTSKDRSRCRSDVIENGRFSNRSPGRTINEATTDKTPNKLVTSRTYTSKDLSKCRSDVIENGRFSNRSPGRTINEATTDKTPNKLVTSRTHTSKDLSKCRSDVIENGRFSNRSPGRTINEATTDKTPNKLVTSRMHTSKDHSRCRSDVIENGRFSNRSPGRTINEATTDKSTNKLVTSRMHTSKDHSRCRSDVIENGRFSNRSPGRTINEATTDKSTNKLVTSRMHTSKDHSRCRSDVIENGRFSNRSPGRTINEATTDKSTNKLVTSRMHTSKDHSRCRSDVIENNNNEHRPSRSLRNTLENKSITHASRLRTTNDSKYPRTESSRDKFLFDNGNDNSQNASLRRYSNKSHTNRVQTTRDSKRPEYINEKDKTPRNELVSSRWHTSKDRKRKTLEDLNTNTQKKSNIIKNNKHFTPKEFSDQENSGNTSCPYQNVALRKSDFTNRVYKSQSKQISDDTSDSESEILTKRNSTNKNSKFQLADKCNRDVKIQLKPNSTLQTLHLKDATNKSIQTSVIQNEVSIENEIQNKSKEITKNSLSTTNVLQNKNSPFFVSKKLRLSNFIDDLIDRKSRNSNKNHSCQELQDKEVQTSCDRGTSVGKESVQKNSSISTNIVDGLEQGNIYDSVASGSIVERFSSFYNHNCLENNIQPWRYSGPLSHGLRDTESRLSEKCPSTTTLGRRSIKKYIRSKSLKIQLTNDESLSLSDVSTHYLQKPKEDQKHKSSKKIGMSSEEVFHTPPQSFVDVESQAASETESVDQSHGIEKWVSDVNNKMNRYKENVPPCRSDTNRNFKNTDNRISYTEDDEEENLTDSNTVDTEEENNGPNSECTVNELQHSLISNSNKLRKEQKQLKPKSSITKTLINKDAEDTEEENNNGPNSECSVNELQHSLKSNSNKLRKEQKQLKPKSSINKTLVNEDTEDTEEKNNNGPNLESSVNKVQHSLIRKSNRLRKKQKQLKPKSSINKTLINKDAEDTEEEDNNGPNSECSVNELQHSLISNSNKLRKEQKQLKPKSSINKTLINKDAEDTEEEDNNGPNSECSVNEQQHSLISNSNKLRKEQKQLKPKSSINKTLINKDAEDTEEEDNNGPNSECSVNEQQHSLISNSNKLRKEQKQLKPKSSINKTLVNEDTEDKQEENYNGPNLESNVNEEQESYDSNKKDDVNIDKGNVKLCIVLEKLEFTTAPEEEKETKIKENKEAKTNRKKKTKQKKERPTEEIPIIVDTGRPVRQRRPPRLEVYDLHYAVNPTKSEIKLFQIKGDISEYPIENNRISKAKANSRKTSKKLINDEDNSSSRSDEEYKTRTTKANKTVKKSRGRYQTKKSKTNKSENKLTSQKDSVIIENSCNFPNITGNRDLDGDIQHEPNLQKSSSKVDNTGKKKRGSPKKSVTKNTRSKFISQEDSTIPENSCNLLVETLEQQVEPDPMNNSNHLEVSEINQNCNIMNGNNSNMDLCENQENPLLQQDKFKRPRKLSEHDSGRSSTMVDDSSSRNSNFPKIFVNGVLTTIKKSRKTISNKILSRKSLIKTSADEYLNIQENGIDKLKFVEKNATFTEMEDNLIYSDSLDHTIGTIIYLRIPPGKVKRAHVCKKHVLFYVVHEGKGKVVVKDKISTIEKLSRLIIPVGHSYSIQNDSQTEDLLLNCVRVPVT